MFESISAKTTALVKEYFLVLEGMFESKWFDKHSDKYDMFPDLKGIFESLCAAESQT